MLIYNFLNVIAAVCNRWVVSCTGSLRNFQNRLWSIYIEDEVKIPLKSVRRPVYNDGCQREIRVVTLRCRQYRRKYCYTKHFVFRFSKLFISFEFSAFRPDGRGNEEKNGQLRTFPTHTNTYTGRSTRSECGRRIREKSHIQIALA